MVEVLDRQLPEMAEPTPEVPLTEVDYTYLLDYYLETHGTKSGGEFRPRNGEVEEHSKDSASAGAVVHFVISHMELSANALKEKIRDHYSNSPWYHKSWAHKTRRSLINLGSVLPQSNEYTEVNFLHETRLYVPIKARRAARELAGILRSARLRSDELGEQVADALRTNPFVLDPDETDGVFQSKVSRLPNDLTYESYTSDEKEIITVTHADIKSLAWDARTLHREYGGNLHMQQSVRTDLIITEHDKKGENAEWISAVTHKFLDVMNSGCAYDPEELTKLTYELPYSTRAFNGAEIIREAVKLIISGDLSLTLLDTKALTREGEIYEDTEPIWDDLDNDLSAIFSPDNYMQDSHGHANIRSIISKNILDVAKSEGTLAMAFSAALYGLNFPVSIPYLMSKIRYGILFADFDIRQKGKSKYPGIPKNVNYAVIPITYEQIVDRWNLWVSRLYTQRALGERAIRAAVIAAQVAENESQLISSFETHPA